MNPHLFYVLFIALNIFVSMCPAHAAITTTTNVDGLTLQLSTKQDSYSTGDQIYVFLVVSNTTGKIASIGVFNDWQGGHVIPTFGEIRIIELTSGKFIMPRKSAIIEGDDIGGEIGPTNSMQFKFNLFTDYSVTNAGNYSVSFRGQLKSPSNLGGKANFELGPLFFQVTNK